MSELRPTNKEKIEKMCQAAGLKPERRHALKDYDVLIADGFSLPPHIKFRKFGIAANDFPYGCYVTFWWLMKGEDRLFIANPIMFDAFHDPQFDLATRKMARINRALQEAAGFVRRMKPKQKRTVLHA